MYTALPTMCPCIAFMTFGRVSKASAAGGTSSFLSIAKISKRLRA